MDRKRRTAIQAAATLLQNANFRGFFTGTIYQGSVKSVCVPGLNCYSCPGALGACPLGSLQNALSSYRFRFPYYVVGLILFFGALTGRLICGFLCPFGWIQDLLHKIPFPKKVRTFRGDRQLRWLKYGILILMVIVLPVCVKLTPFFCKYVCPAGTLSGILLSLSDHRLYQVLGALFTWKVIVLAAVTVFSIIVARPFCKFICPLGAVYGMCNQVSLVRMSVDRDACVHCGKCAAVCDMIVDPSVNPNSAECIRCGECVSACPAKALHLGVREALHSKKSIEE